MPNLKKDFAGVITGASSGIGRELAITLAKKRHARLVLNARSVSDLEKTKQDVEANGGKAFIIAGDVAEPGMAERLVDRCLQEFGDIDVLINNAGLGHPGQLIHLTPADWERVFAVNFFAPLHAIYRALPHFLKKGGGKIVNISSVAGKVAFPGSVCYASSKFALQGMSEGMAAELASKHIDIVTVCPGWVRTEFFEKNNMSDAKNPTLIAQKNNVSGLLMRYVLSISSKQAADDIYRALSRDGSQEIVLTFPGVAVERLKGVCPQVVRGLSRLIPPAMVDARKTSASKR